MKVLVINCGSSSLKYQIIDMDTQDVLCKGLVERIGIEGSLLTHKVPGHDDVVIKEDMKDHKRAVELVMEALVDPEHGVIKSLDEIDAIGHRVVHGGQKFAKSVLIDDEVKEALNKCTELAPLHNPANILGIQACEAVMPGKPNVGVFDTAFGMGMEPKAFMYALPTKYYEEYEVRRYGFHGQSHDFVSHRALALCGKDPATTKVIVCHLGNGASISASIGGKCVDSSMGLTPLEGLIMGTRSGNVDPGIMQFICHKEGVDIDGMLAILNKKSGIFGLSGGISSDFRDVQKAADEGNEKAKIALDAFRYRVAKYIGSYAAAMNGVDVIVFTAGLGENDKLTRQEICDKYLGYLGVKVDPERNNVRGKEALISSDDSKVQVYLIPTNEELKIAMDTVKIVSEL
ncbi:MAG: acetate kinase [Lachnospiraceae bacterium]|nr:acetate kinase [Lachnospiraceae bacterium]MBR2532819.1 acetate kinase [Lachnospiraceae bacterium]